jgi:BON domain
VKALSLITLPARLGYEVARRSLDIAAGAGRMAGLFGDSEPMEAPAPPPRAAAKPTSNGTGAAEPAAPPPRTAPSSLQSEDVELIKRVKTEVLRDAEAPEFEVDVNPIGGVVKLSGRAEGADHVRELQRRALSVPGVKRVENELSVPDTPAPGPFNAERHRPDAEPLPKHLAESGKGRQPAPLGADDSPPAPS